MTDEALTLMLMLLCRGGLTLRLFSGDDGGAYREVEGYSPAPTAAEWRVADLAAEHPKVVFRFGRPDVGPVAGWFVTAGETVVGGERFAAGPFDVRAAGSTIAITPRLRLRR